MINKELYNIAIKADKVAANTGYCGNCFCGLFKEKIKNSFILKKSFYNWKRENNIHTNCSSVLFYLQDLGIIEILSGVTTRDNGVICKNLKYTINKNFFQGNKI